MSVHCKVIFLIGFGGNPCTLLEEVKLVPQNWGGESGWCLQSSVMKNKNISISHFQVGFWELNRTLQLNSPRALWYLRSLQNFSEFMEKQKTASFPCGKFPVFNCQWFLILFLKSQLNCFQYIWLCFSIWESSAARFDRPQGSVIRNPLINQRGWKTQLHNAHK